LGRGAVVAGVVKAEKGVRVVVVLVEVLKEVRT
jgi:hypothetical protein